SALALILIPEFVRVGRSTMLEPGIMFFIWLCLYFHFRFRHHRGFRWSVPCALAFTAAFLSKGVPALVVLPVLITYDLLERFLRRERGPLLSPSKMGLHLLTLVG